MGRMTKDAVTSRVCYTRNCQPLGWFTLKELAKHVLNSSLIRAWEGVRRGFYLHCTDGDNETQGSDAIGSKTQLINDKAGT